MCLLSVSEGALLQGRFNLKAIEHIPEVEALVRAMLAAQPAKRPCLKGIMQQPFWWSPARRLAFLIHLSDRVETEDREVHFCPTGTSPLVPSWGFAAVESLSTQLFLPAA